MIPTRSKSKLPKTLSYPLGAEAISEALADAPHATEFTLGFSDSPVWSASEFRRRLREGLRYPVLVAEYEPVRKPGYSGNNDLTEHGWYDAHWWLWVYPVLRERRPVVAQLLREQGLPAVVEWLRLCSRAGWERREHRLQLVFNGAEGTLSIQPDDGV